ncbi:hypothetical protein ACIBCB_18530 [Streptomyces uncialis]
MTSRIMLRARPDCGSRSWDENEPDECVLFAAHPGLCTHSLTPKDKGA